VPRVPFSNLSRLTLWGIQTSPQCLKQFLLGASSALRWFKFWLIRLSCSEAEQASVEDTLAAGRRAWRDMWDFFCDSMSLEHLEFHRLKFGNLDGPSNHIRVVDRLHGPRGSNSLVRETDLAFFDATRAEVGFREWIDQIEFETEDEFWAAMNEHRDNYYPHLVAYQSRG
jgi:hypothetical protein